MKDKCAAGSEVTGSIGKVSGNVEVGWGMAAHGNVLFYRIIWRTALVSASSLRKFILFVSDILYVIRCFGF